VVVRERQEELLELVCQQSQPVQESRPATAQAPLSSSDALLRGLWQWLRGQPLLAAQAGRRLVEGQPDEQVPVEVPAAEQAVLAEKLPLVEQVRAVEFEELLRGLELSVVAPRPDELWLERRYPHPERKAK
jgi:hypothetical protein